MSYAEDRAKEINDLIYEAGVDLDSDIYGKIKDIINQMVDDLY